MSSFAVPQQAAQGRQYTRARVYVVCEKAFALIEEGRQLCSVTYAVMAIQTAMFMYPLVLHTPWCSIRSVSWVGDFHLQTICVHLVHGYPHDLASTICVLSTHNMRRRRAGDDGVLVPYTKGTRRHLILVCR